MTMEHISKALAEAGESYREEAEYYRSLPDVPQGFWPVVADMRQARGEKLLLISIFGSDEQRMSATDWL